MKRFARKLHELERQALDTQARQEGYNNGVRLAILGCREYSNELDKEVSTERREEGYENESINSEREIDPVEDPSVDTEVNLLGKVVCHFQLYFPY